MAVLVVRGAVGEGGVVLGGEGWGASGAGGLCGVGHML